MSPELPGAKAQAIRAEFGEEAATWIDSFPSLITTLLDRWDLEITGMADAGLPINVIYYVTDGEGSSRVLKVGYPHPEQQTEITALANFDSPMVVSMIAHDRALGAVLLPAIGSGTMFRSIRDARSTIPLPALAEVPAPLTSDLALPTYKAWLQKAVDQYGEVTFAKLPPGPAETMAGYLEDAQYRFADLDAAYPGPHLLHGDLHHENLLLADDGSWVAIDPKGVIGPAVMECGRYLHNFVHDEVPGADSLEGCSDDDMAGILRQRCTMLNNLTGVPPATIARTGFVDLALAYCWSVNSGGNISADWLRLLRVLRNLSDE